MWVKRVLISAVLLGFIAVSFAQNKLYGVGFVPFMAGGDQVEQRMFRTVGELGEVDEMFAIENGNHMLETLGKLRRQGRKLDFLVIAGHGAKNDPAIGFAQEELLPKHVDLKRMQEELAKAKSILARSNLTAAQRATAKAKVEELQAPVNLLEQVPGVMKPGAVVILLNCSPLASEAGTKFVKDLGKLLLSPGGGRIIASKSDVTFLEVEDLWDQAAHLFKNGGVKAWGDSFVGGDWVVGVCPPGLLSEKPLPKSATHTKGTSSNPKATTKPTEAVGAFHLVETILGEVPPPGEANDHKIWGHVSESSWSVNIEMKPPYEGRASLVHTYKKGKLGTTLKPGDVIELQAVSISSKGGSYEPNLGGNAWWAVEGSVEILEEGKNFVGTASTGKFYPAASCRTRFKVLKASKGAKIKIVAVQTGQVWGSSKQWNPVTYIYEFK